MDGDAPDDDIVIQTLVAGQGATAADICDFLEAKYSEKRGAYRPQKKNGPRKFSWFPAVVGEHFTRENRRRAAEGRTPKHWTDCPVPSDPDFEHMISAMELADASNDCPDSDD